MSNRIPLTLLTGVALVVLVIGTVPAAQVPKVKKQPTEREVLDKLFGTTWEETEKMVAGKLWPKHRYDPLGWKFSAEGVELWEMTGEMSTSTYSGIKIDVGVEPWRMDIFNKENGKITNLLPTIIKFDGDDIIWATEYPGEGWYHKLDPEGNYKDRPTGFESTEKNRYMVCRLKPEKVPAQKDK